MRLMVAGLVTLMACGTVDADQDGFDASVDCDDNDNRVFPGGNEICDGIDNDCSGTLDDVYAAGGTVFYVDADGDGFGVTEQTLVTCVPPEGFVENALDCDDGMESIHPGADELCDDLDQDCDGTVDEDAVDAPTWHADWDQDGFGSMTQLVRACDVPPGFVADAQDCNDFDLAVNPSAEEMCDRIDNDCDDVIDEPDATDARDWFEDADADGFGNADVALRACFLPDGYADEPTDCNDGSALQSPGIEEICRDGIDNNCNELPDQCTLSAWGDVTDATRTWGATGSRPYLGYDVKAVGDLDGDGFEDLIGGAWYESISGNFGTGRAWIVYGDDFEATPDPTLLADEPSVYGTGRTAYAGRALNGLGDINGDGYDDFAVGAYGARGRAGEVAIVYGASDRRDGATVMSALPMFTGSSRAELGLAVGGGGDLDADGYDDMALGAQGVSSRRGAVYLIYGDSDMLDGTTSVTSAADATFTGPGSSAYLGGEGTLGTPGDFDGDGHQDMILGAWRATGRTSWSGAAWVLYGDSTRRSGSASISTLEDGVAGESFFQYFGSGNGSVGDINDDGYDDMGFGCYGCSSYAGELRIFFGGTTRIGDKVASDYDMSIIGDSRAYVGRFAPAGGDLDGDGIDDLAVGAYYDSPGGNTYSGSVYVLKGAPGLGGEYEAASGDLDAVIHGPPDRFQYFGRGIGIGDVTGDGLPDLVAGSERAGGNTGRMYLFAGTSL